MLKISTNFLKQSAKLFPRIPKYPTSSTNTTTNTTANKQLQQHKPTPAQIHAQSNNIMSKVALQKNYKLLNSSPIDSIQQIRGNFIQIKKKLSNRHYYIPNKKQYLLKLDHAYQQIMKVHQDYNILDYSKPKGYITKSQLITYQLQKIKKVKIYNLMQTYQFSAILLLVFLFMEIFVQEYEDWNVDRFQIIQRFQFGDFVKKLYGKIWDNVDRNFQRKFKEMGINIDEKVTVRITNKGISYQQQNKPNIDLNLLQQKLK